MIAGLLKDANHGLLVDGVLGGLAGTILGLFIGLSQVVSRSRQFLGLRGLEPVIGAERSARVCDPWLDDGRDPEWVCPEPGSTVTGEQTPVYVTTRGGFPAERAHVRPQVISPTTGEMLLLEDEIGRWIQAAEYGLVIVLGRPGSGKTTTLRHLTACLPPWALARVRLLDEPGDYAAIVATAARDCLVICT